MTLHPIIMPDEKVPDAFTLLSSYDTVLRHVRPNEGLWFFDVSSNRIHLGWSFSRCRTRLRDEVVWIDTQGRTMIG